MATVARTNGRARGPQAITDALDHGQPPGSALASAVLAVQTEVRKLLPNADGQIQNRSYRYVTLGAVTDEVLPLLVEHELLWRTFPTRDEDGAPALRYRMTHIPSGESDEDLMALVLDRE